MNSCFDCIVLPCCINRFKSMNCHSVLNFMWKIGCTHYDLMNNSTQEEINKIRVLFNLNPI